MANPIEAEIDKLFQLPPDQFTAARNTLAKDAGAQKGAIKGLTKPPVAAWAVNQLYWQAPERYEALVEASTDVRRTHRSVIEGRKGDLREAGRAHEAALDGALKATVELMRAAGQPVTDATRHAILNTLRALPSIEPAGRLTKALTPGGFEMLSGMTPAAPAASAPRPKPAVKARGADAKAEGEAARERDRRAALERAVREADQRARQAEFEAARAAREVAKTDRHLDEARRELEAAQKAYEEADRQAQRAAKAREAADRRQRDAQSVLATAKSRT